MSIKRRDLAKGLFALPVVTVVPNWGIKTPIKEGAPIDLNQLVTETIRTRSRQMADNALAYNSLWQRVSEEKK